MNNQHIFTLYVQNLENLSPENKITLHNKEIKKRITKILRLKKNDKITLFNEKYEYEALLLDTFPSSPAKLLLKIENKKQIMPSSNITTVFIGILKKSDFEDAVYTATEMGCHKIIPFISEKSEKNWINEQQIKRLKKIIISACEQSKNLFIPTILHPIPLKKASSLWHNQNKICFHPSGKSINSLLEKTPTLAQKPRALLIGPHADLTTTELKFLAQEEFQIYKLTPTILRSKDAVTLATGIISSIIRR